jgi:hypothetical protein
VGVAEFAILLVIGGACYAALTPLRRAFERWILRSGRRAGLVIPLIRNTDGAHTPPARKSDGDE